MTHVSEAIAEVLQRAHFLAEREGVSLQPPPPPALPFTPPSDEAFQKASQTLVKGLQASRAFRAVQPPTRRR